MALIKCRECGEEVSGGTMKCPKCGAFSPNKTFWFMYLIVAWVVGATVLIAMFAS
ncbi:MAG: hypothetical protein R3B94_13355 [Hyphomonas sp.]